MKIFRFHKTIGRNASKKPAVVILSADMSEINAEKIKSRFPKSLLIAECRPGKAAREGFFSVLRITADELARFDGDLCGCRAVLIEGAAGMFTSEAQQYCERIARRLNIAPGRVRLCCNMLSQQENRSCYSAAAIRDYASEMGITGLWPTAKKECLNQSTLCSCVKCFPKERIDTQSKI